MLRQIVLVAQIYVEIERARLTRKLAQLKEQEGNIAEAADVLQEVAVVSCCSIRVWHPCTHALGATVRFYTCNVAPTNQLQAKHQLFNPVHGTVLL